MKAVRLCKDASSVLMPEIAIPSAGKLPLSRVNSRKRSILPESFRGGCSFGPGDKTSVSRFRLKSYAISKNISIDNFYQSIVFLND